MVVVWPQAKRRQSRRSAGFDSCSFRKTFSSGCLITTLTQEEKKEEILFKKTRISTTASGRCITVTTSQRMLADTLAS